MTIVEQLEQKGLQEGRRKEAASMLSRILQRRFGPLPANVQSFLETASVEELENRVDAALDARTLDEVFPA